MAQPIETTDFDDIITILKYHNVPIPSYFKLWFIPNINKIFFKGSDVLYMLGLTIDTPGGQVSKFYTKDFLDKIKSTIKGTNIKCIFITEQGLYTAICKIKFGNFQTKNIAHQLHEAYNKLIEVVRRSHRNLYVGVLTDNTILLTNEERKEYEKMKEENKQIKTYADNLENGILELDQQVNKLFKKLKIVEEHNVEILEDYNYFQGNIYLIKGCYDPVKDIWDEESKAYHQMIELGNSEYIERFKEYIPIIHDKYKHNQRKNPWYKEFLYDVIEKIIEEYEDNEIKNFINNFKH